MQGSEAGEQGMLNLAPLTILPGISLNVPVIHCRANKGKLKLVSRWAGLRTSCGQVQNDNERVWGSGKVAGGRICHLPFIFKL